MAERALYSAGQLLALFGILFAALGVGDRLLGRLGIGNGLRSALAVALGLAAWAQVGFLLLLAGRFERLWLAPFVAAAWIAALPAAERLLAGVRRRPLWALAAGLLGSPLFLAAIYPKLAFDETLYHLPFARGFVESGGADFAAGLRTPVFPVLSEVLAAGLMLFGDETSTHLVALLATLGTAALLWAWASERGNAWAGIFAAALWLGGPQILYLAGTGYPEPLLALWVGAALCAVDLYGTDGERRWLWLAGLAVGSAAAAKYLGLFFGGWVAAELALIARRGERSGALGRFALAGALAALPTYARLISFTGNPLFPYLSGVFGFNPWTPAPEVTQPTWLTPGAWLSMPFDAVFRRHLVGGLPPFSPGFLLAAPWLALAAWRLPRARLALGAAAVYSLVVPLHARYLVLALPPLAWIAAREALRTAESWSRRRRRLAAVAALAVLLAPGGLWLGRHLRRLGPLPATAAARDAFWTERRPLWPAVRFVNEVGAGAPVYVMSGESMHDFVRGSMLGDWTGPLPYRRAARLARSPAALHGALRTLDVEYLIWPRSAAADTAAPGWLARFERVYADESAEVFRLREGAGAAGGGRSLSKWK